MKKADIEGNRDRYRKKNKVEKDDRGGTRTHNPLIRSQMRYPLRHAVTTTTFSNTVPHAYIKNPNHQLLCICNYIAQMHFQHTHIICTLYIYQHKTAIHHSHPILYTPHTLYILYTLYTLYTLHIIHTFTTFYSLA